MESGRQFSSVDDMFKGHAAIAAPWPSAPTTKTRKLGYDPAHVSSGLKDAPLEHVDPNKLHATQPMILREHVDYYSSPQYNQTGRTSADQHNEVNRQPVVYERQDGRQLIVSGHHRAAAAMVRGEPLSARVVREPK